MSSPFISTSLSLAIHPPFITDWHLTRSPHSHSCLSPRYTRSTAALTPSALESQYHSNFLETRVRSFVGRTSLVSSLASLATSSSSSPHRPLVIVGQAGGGKSSLMAKIISNVLNAIPQWDKESFTFYHFVGASPKSVLCTATLARLCEELTVRILFQIQICWLNPFSHIFSFISKSLEFKQTQLTLTLLPLTLTHFLPLPAHCWSPLPLPFLL